MENLTVDGKSIYDLKVTELKDELGKRSLSKSGNKQQLVSRLSEYLVTNPEGLSDNIPEKEKSPDKKSGDPPVNTFIAQYLAERDSLLAASLDHKRKVQTAEQKLEEEHVIEDTENNTKMSLASEPVDLATSSKTRPSSGTQRTSTSLSPTPDERENGGTKLQSPELGPTDLRSNRSTRSTPAKLEEPQRPTPGSPPAPAHSVEARALISPPPNIVKSPKIEEKILVSDRLLVSRDKSTDASQEESHVVSEKKLGSSSGHVAGGLIPPVSAVRSPSPGSADSLRQRRHREPFKESVVPSVAGSGAKTDDLKKDFDVKLGKTVTIQEKDGKRQETFVREPKSTETVSRSDGKAAAAVFQRKLTESLSIEEEKLDYGEIEADDDVVLKDDSSTIKASEVVNTRKRHQPPAMGDHSSSIVVSSDTIEELFPQTEAKKTGDSRETNEPPRKMARSGLGSVSEESKAAASSESQTSPPPSKSPVSRMLHITRLVRPFTVPALKELLKKSGALVDDAEHFWIDGIKSQCIVTYNSEDEAEAARKALYNLVWPSSSNQKLIVEFIREEEFKERSSGVAAVTTATSVSTPQEPKRPVATSRPHIDRPTVEKLKITVASNKETGEAQRDVALSRDLEKRGLERREREERSKQEVSAATSVRKEETIKEKVLPERIPEREWDRGKEPTVKPEEPAKPVEATRLEVLFQRTESRPQLYWKPLTDEEVKSREDDNDKPRHGDERRPPVADSKPRFLDRIRNDSNDRRPARRDSPPRRSPSRERGYRAGGNRGGGYGGNRGGYNRRRPSPRRSSPFTRKRSRSPYRGGRRSRSPSRNRNRRW